METSAAAPVEFAIPARSFAHGPTPSSLSRVRTTVTPLRSSTSRTSSVTAQANACSG
jgi:hypothetical protein